MPRVVPIDGERWAFRVQSASDARRWYSVCLEAHGGAGSCDCSDWTMRHGPALGKGGTVTRCKHIRLARGLVINTLLSASAVNAVFGQTLHNIVRIWFERVAAESREAVPLQDSVSGH